MVGTVLFLILLPVLVICSGDGNIRILEDEIAVALKACTYPNDNTKQKEVIKERPRRSESLDDVSAKIDDETKQINQYNQEKRHSGSREQIHVLNATDHDYEGYGSGNMGERLGNRSTNTNKTKRSDPLLYKADTDQV